MRKARTKKVSNINGTSKNESCRCGSWLDHWKKFSGEPLPSLCPERGCRQTDLVGAHVQRVDANDQSWYILPLCSGHNNQRGATLDLYPEMTVVSANVAETCG